MKTISLFVSALANVAIVLTFWVYYKQLLAMKSASRGQNILSVVTFLWAEPFRKALGVVRWELPGKALPWSDDERQAASRVCGTYDILGIMIKAEVVPPEPFLENWGASICHAHEILTPFIEESRKSPTAGPKYWDDFDWLDREVISYGRSEGTTSPSCSLRTWYRTSNLKEKVKAELDRLKKAIASLAE